MESKTPKQSYETPTVADLGSIVEQTEGSPVFDEILELDPTSPNPYRIKMAL
jgi:hypothetical protein